MVGSVKGGDLASMGVKREYTKLRVGKENENPGRCYDFTSTADKRVWNVG